MQHRTNKLSPISSFPIDWASFLPNLLGSIAFSMEHSEREPREWLGLVSSHQSRLGYAIQDWQDSLQSALKLAQSQQWGILCARDTPYSDILIHACNRFSIPLRIIHTDADNATVCQLGNIHLSRQEPETNKRNAIPLHDRAVVFLADKLFVLALSDGGKIAKLLAERLEMDCIPPGTTYLAIPDCRSGRPNPGRVNQCRVNQGRVNQGRVNQGRMDWLERGVVGWLNIASNEESDGDFTIILPNRSEATYLPFLSIHLLASSRSNYLIHCTRSRRGPWPDQSVAQFHDELLNRPWRAQPTVLETLLRILQQRRLIATNAYRRGNTPTVCFSGNSISELLAMRRFQSHLARWDWEPYGIMIEREWLIQRGAKPVSYIDRNAIKSQTDEELAFTQVVANEPGSPNWQEEQEWRIAGDLRLSSIPFSKAIVFAPTFAEALELQKFSLWPIAITRDHS